MRFKRSRKRILVITAAFLALLHFSVSRAQEDADTNNAGDDNATVTWNDPAPAEPAQKQAAKKHAAPKAAAKKAAPRKTADKNASAKPAPRPQDKGPKVAVMKPVRRPDLKLPAEKTQEKSADSLEGEVFNRTTGKDRLSGGDAERYERIFALQDVGNFKKANEAIHQLDDDRLMGRVLYQRYMSRAYKPTYNELAIWMRLYADHPNAQRIYDLAVKRKPEDAAPLTPPNPGRGLTGYHDYDSGQLAQPYMAGQDYNAQEQAAIKAIDENLSESPIVARRRLDTAASKNIFENTKYDALQAKVAEAYFFNNKVGEAYEQAAASSDRSGRDVPLAGWIAGLAAWKNKRYEEAARYFERTALSPRASAWTSSAGAFWAARCYLRSHHPEKVSFWLQKAAEHPRSFYGIIAVKALGMEQTRFNWAMPELDDKLAKSLASVPAGKRALALLDAEHPEWAEQEMRQINPGSDIDMQRAMMAFAHTAGEPAFEMRLGSGLQDAKGKLYDAALYPDAPWRPDGGYYVDKALVNAFIRQESKFETLVENESSGATGLMQLMPATAMLIAHRMGIKIEQSQLGTPAVNLELGQKYLQSLLQDDSVKNNLFKLAVAYNAGPGKLARWERTVDYENDPLLFIESIPVAETRLFVQRVLTNYWVYRLKYNENTDSLELVASGEWPLYSTSQNIVHGNTALAAAER